MSPPSRACKIQARIDQFLQHQGPPRANLESFRDLVKLEGEEFVVSAFALVSDSPLDRETAQRFAAYLKKGAAREFVFWFVATSEPGHADGSNPAWLAVLTADILHSLTVSDLLERTGPLFLELSYCRLLGRPPEPEGIAHWSRLLEQGCRKEFILWSLLRSPEGQARGNLPVGAEALEAWTSTHASAIEILALEGQDFLELAYGRIYGRKPAPEDAAYWADLRARGCRKDLLFWLLLHHPKAGDQPRGLEGCEMIERWSETQASAAEILTLEENLFLELCYRRLLGRAPEPGDVAHCAGLLANGYGKEIVFWLILHSPEAAARSCPLQDMKALGAWAGTGASVPEMLLADGLAFLELCHRRLLGRRPDPAGAMYWTGLLEKGCSKECILWAMFRRPEAAGRALGTEDTRTLDGWARTGATIVELLALETPAFVELSYFRLLGRPPDEEGAAHWTNLMRRGGSKELVLWSMLRCSEVRERACLPQGVETLEAWAGSQVRVPEILLADGPLFLELCYRRLLGSVPDPEGAAHWTNLIGRGGSKELVLWCILHCPEVRERACVPQGVETLEAWAGSQVGVPEILLADGPVFLELCFRRLLGRAPDSEEATYCADLMGRGASKHFLLWTMVRCPEARARACPPQGAEILEGWAGASIAEVLLASTSEFLELSYRRLLGRPPAMEEIVSWTAVMERGCTKEEALWMMICSPEVRTGPWRPPNTKALAAAVASPGRLRQVLQAAWPQRSFAGLEALLQLLKGCLRGAQHFLNSLVRGRAAHAAGCRPDASDLQLDGRPAERLAA